MSEISGARNKSKIRQLALIGVVLSMAVIVIAGYIWWRYNGTPSFSRYDAVLTAFKNHRVVVGDEGRVDLSRQFPGITGHNDAYITYRDDGTFIVMFPTYYGKGSEVAGLVYTSRPLTDDDTHARVSSIHFDQRLIQAGSYANLLLEERINSNWYHVSYRIR